MPPQSMMDHNFNIPSSEPPSPLPETRIKCVLVGDGAVGKTSLIVSYTINDYPTEYMPTAFDNYSVVVTVDNKPIRLQLCDTAGQTMVNGRPPELADSSGPRSCVELSSHGSLATWRDDFDSLRPLCYPETNVFMLCFSVMCPTSYQNVVDKWVPEVRKHSPDAPIILVGTQCDLRNDVKVLIELAHYNEKPITEETAKQLAERIGAIDYVECSALTQKNLKEVFDSAILSSLDIFKKPKPIKRRISFRRSRKDKKRTEKKPQPVIPMRPLSDCSVKKVLIFVSKYVCSDGKSIWSPLVAADIVTTPTIDSKEQIEPHTESDVNTSPVWKQISVMFMIVVSASITGNTSTGIQAPGLQGPGFRHREYKHHDPGTGKTSTGIQASGIQAPGLRHREYKHRDSGTGNTCTMIQAPGIQAPGLRHRECKHRDSGTGNTCTMIQAPGILAQEFRHRENKHRDSKPGFRHQEYKHQDSGTGKTSTGIQAQGI
ncbi:RHOU-like protein [Mya arenaria]|uniref:RHOU-like protein n=1 Tax=Mya arenaria TaxID=6604 RepID=A0ABY7FBI1_MYAAR|nr:RHOU-like protein [Mya arenaria]